MSWLHPRGLPLCSGFCFTCKPSCQSWLRRWDSCSAHTDTHMLMPAHTREALEHATAACAACSLNLQVKRVPALCFAKYLSLYCFFFLPNQVQLACCSCLVFSMAMQATRLSNTQHKHVQLLFLTLNLWDLIHVLSLPPAIWAFFSFHHFETLKS